MHQRRGTEPGGAAGLGGQIGRHVELSADPPVDVRMGTLIILVRKVFVRSIIKTGVRDHGS